MSDWAAATLLALSSFLSIDTSPVENGKWIVLKPWDVENSSPSFSAKSTPHLISECLTNSSSKIVFPSIIHGAQTIKLNGRELLNFGDPSFMSFRSFYGRPSMKCTEIKQPSDYLEWEVSSYTKYFARFNHWPEVQISSVSENIFTEYFNLLAGINLLLLAPVVLLFFLGKSDNLVAITITVACIGLAVYFFTVSSGLLFVGIPMLLAHKIADVGLWVGLGSFVLTLQFQGLIKPKTVRIYLGIVTLSIIVIVFGFSGDQVQLGTTLPFIPTLALMVWALVALGRRLYKDPNKSSILAVTSLSLFVLASFNDVFVVLGVSNNPAVLAVGFMGGMSFQLLSLNQEIIAAYKHRAYLADNLELEVSKKTKELKDSLEQLANYQAELIQSEKLVALGTLAAGIAHEINNSLNYVNGALTPLRKVLTKCNFDQSEKCLKLIDIADQGLQFTFKIMNSLRNYTGLNQAPKQYVDVGELIDSVLVILNRRLKEKGTLVKQVESGLTIYGSPVGLSQVIMNLIVNAHDAIGVNGEIQVRAQRRGENVAIEVIDNGSGIPERIKSKIFDPFFTTKKVGQGTGLGLHIARQEVGNSGGTIDVVSEEGKGTSFIIVFKFERQEVLAA
jgi:signal transduction histidine kinase